MINASQPFSKPPAKKASIFLLFIWLFSVVAFTFPVLLISFPLFFIYAMRMCLGAPFCLVSVEKDSTIHFFFPECPSVCENVECTEKASAILVEIYEQSGNFKACCQSNLQLHAALHLKHLKC